VKRNRGGFTSGVEARAPSRKLAVETVPLLAKLTVTACALAWLAAPVNTTTSASQQETNLSLAMTILLDPVSDERGLRIGAVEGSSGAFFGLSLKAPSKRTGPPTHSARRVRARQRCRRSL